MRAIVIACFLTIGGVVVCSAEKPPCTGDRHEYCGSGGSGGGESATTTTTLPSPGCPDQAPCPVVVCDCGSGSGAFVGVNVQPCVESNYVRCRRLANGKIRCPIKDHPRRVFVPEGK